MLQVKACSHSLYFEKKFLLFHLCHVRKTREHYQQTFKGHKLNLWKLETSNFPRESFIGKVIQFKDISCCDNPIKC